MTPAQRAAQFLSPPSARRATQYSILCHAQLKISIPTLREEGDQVGSCRPIPSADFYPHPPRGGRPGTGRSSTGHDRFLSPPSARRATIRSEQGAAFRNYFYPHPPRGGRPRDGFTPAESGEISIPTLREEGDDGVLLSHKRVDYFYPHPPRGGRPGVGGA